MYMNRLAMKTDKNLKWKCRLVKSVSEKNYENISNLPFSFMCLRQTAIRNKNDVSAIFKFMDTKFRI